MIYNLCSLLSSLTAYVLVHAIICIVFADLYFLCTVAEYSISVYMNFLVKPLGTLSCQAMA